jgi:phenylalanyl-tRNA synthetase beta chain
MKAPVSWLREYVDFDDSIDELVDKLTFSGIEVEGVETVGGDFEGIVVGEVLSVDPHPNADRLRLCTVRSGDAESRVVCGAPNVTVGGKYPFAPIGFTLPNGIKLKKAKIRGEVSEGMLCAEDELCISDDHEGLMVLDSGLAAGTPLADVLGPPETVLDLEITPNRPDCLSMMGVARELAALSGGVLKVPSIALQESGDHVDARTSVRVEDPGGCPRYVARILHDIEIKPAPEWMQKRLTLAGVRPINNVVDITNYVMLETGQPLHAFDKSLLKEERIAVRRARPGEKMRTLDDIERTLDEDTLLITDAESPVALAGIMGGGGCEIHEQTKTVLLESACFDAAAVRVTSRRLGLSTESSYRFERGVDIGGVDWASRRATGLMAECAGGSPSPGAIDVFAPQAAPCSIQLRYERVSALIGLEISGAEIRRLLEALALRVTAEDETSCTVEVPSFRGDLEREVDLIEEVARLHGLDKIPAPSPRAELVVGADDRRTRSLYDLRARLTGLGLQEIMNYSYTSTDLLDAFKLDDPQARVLLPNPLSQDHSVLRTSLIPQLVESLGRNAARQVNRVAFFEFGTVYHREAEGSHREEAMLAIGLMGSVGRTGVGSGTSATSGEAYLWAKGIWEAISSAQSVTSWELGSLHVPALEEGMSTEITGDGRRIGILGALDRSICSAWRISEPVVVLEVSLERLLEADNRRGDPVDEVPVFPAIRRDVAMLLDEAITHQRVLSVVEKVRPAELENIALFDVFSGKGIAAGRKSLAYAFTYRSPERTLTDEEANRLHDGVKSALQQDLAAEIRDH